MDQSIIILVKSLSNQSLRMCREHHSLHSLCKLLIDCKGEAAVVLGGGLGELEVELESERVRQAMSQEADGGSPGTGRPKRAKWTAGKASMALRIMRWKRRGSAQSSGEAGSQPRRSALEASGR